MALVCMHARIRTLLSTIFTFNSSIQKRKTQNHGNLFAYWRRIAVDKPVILGPPMAGVTEFALFADFAHDQGAGS